MVVSAVQVYEPFNYPPGSNLAGNNGWVLSSGTNPKIATNALVTPGLQPATEGNSVVFGGGAMEIRRGLKNALGGELRGVYFYSFAFNVVDLGSLSTNGGFIAAFSATNPPGVYGGRLYLRKDIGGDANGYNLGVSRASGATEDIAWAANVFATAQTNFVVCRYATADQGDANTYLWINPDPSTYGAANAPTPDLIGGTGLNPLVGVSQIVLRQGSVSEGPGAIIVDTLRVEGGWPEVTPVPLTMTASLADNTNVYLYWGGNQNVFLQQATNLTPPITWINLNPFPDSADIHDWTVTNAASDPRPRFYRVIAWYVE
jgi:hypothetical protein